MGWSGGYCQLGFCLHRQDQCIPRVELLQGSLRGIPVDGVLEGGLRSSQAPVALLSGNSIGDIKSTHFQGSTVANLHRETVPQEFPLGSTSEIREPILCFPCCPWTLPFLVLVHCTHHSNSWPTLAGPESHQTQSGRGSQALFGFSDLYYLS